jgi:hypothetical protein
MEIPWKKYFEKKREREYSGKSGFVSIFLGAKK